jgi:hypothetical protein
MRKTRLKIEELDVESFPTRDVDAGERGTVHAHQTYIFEGCGQTQFQTCAPTNLGAPCFCA